MSELNEILNRWQQIPSTHISMASIKRDAAMQPRNTQAINFKNRAAYETALENHVSNLSSRLAFVSDLDPILVAKTDDGLLIVDGHHRFMAYQRKLIKVIPARVMHTSHAEAVAISKLANLSQRAMPLHKDQAIEACWQHLGYLTNKGRQKLPEGVSGRSIARQFGLSPNTPCAMLKRLANLNLSEYSPEAKDSSTQLPYWKYVRGNSQRDWIQVAGDDIKAQRQAEKLVKTARKCSPEINREALKLLIIEFIAEAEAFDTRETATAWLESLPEEFIAFYSGTASYSLQKA